MILSRITTVLLDRNTIGRTELSQKANVNYTRLLRHIEWLQDKELVDLIVERGKVKVRLSNTGKEFAKTLSK